MSPIIYRCVVSTYLSSEDIKYCPCCSDSWSNGLFYKPHFEIDDQDVIALQPFLGQQLVFENTTIHIVNTYEVALALRNPKYFAFNHLFSVLQSLRPPLGDVPSTGSFLQQWQYSASDFNESLQMLHGPTLEADPQHPAHLEYCRAYVIHFLPSYPKRFCELRKRIAIFRKRMR